MNQAKNIIWSGEKVSRLWGYYASNPSYKNQYFSHHSGKYILKYSDKFLTYQGKKILDYGCGPGHLLKEICLYSPEKVYGLDFSKESVYELTKNFKEEPLFGGAYSLEKLPSSFADESMDVVTAVEVIEHLNDQQLSETIKEIKRVLVPGGFIILTTPNKEDLEASKTICPDCGSIFHRWQHIRSFDVMSLKKILEKEGFMAMHAEATVFGSLAKRLYYNLIKVYKKDFDYPHLIYIGKKSV
ncbi:MAG: class I SAM-dependent methyltransferase [Candidatus Omnitrophica bacterium]|nr:class I SAM-dependent methyltransferase [Candidatus Omnitrophota bacterium]